MEEVWKDIDGFNNRYQVSNLGNVKSLSYRNSKKPHLMTLRKQWNGYLYVMLVENKKQKFVAVHRLVAKAFCDNPQNKPHVNHLNNIRDDNRAENLEWCTVSENQKYAWAQGRKNNENQIEAMRKKGFINLIHARENQKKTNYEKLREATAKSRKPVAAYNKDGIEVARYESTCAVVKDGYNEGHVASCARGERKTHKKLTWKYI